MDRILRRVTLPIFSLSTGCSTRNDEVVQFFVQPESFVASPPEFLGEAGYNDVLPLSFRTPSLRWSDPASLVLFEPVSLDCRYFCGH